MARRRLPVVAYAKKYFVKIIESNVAGKQYATPIRAIDAGDCIFETTTRLDLKETRLTSLKERREDRLPLRKGKDATSVEPHLWKRRLVTFVKS